MRVTHKNVIWFARCNFKIRINVHIIVAVVERLVTIDIVSVCRSVEKSFKKLKGEATGVPGGGEGSGRKVGRFGTAA
jgi:hypothetical protein